MLAPSLARLRQLDPVLADRWAQLAVFPAPFDRAAAAAVWGALSDPPAEDVRAWPVPTPLPDAETRAALSALVQQSLLDYDPATATYTLHDLLRECILADPRGRSGRCTPAPRLALPARRSAADHLYQQGGPRAVEGVQAFRIVWPHLLAAWRWLQDRSTPWPCAGSTLLQRRDR